MSLCMKSIWKYIENKNCQTVTTMEWEKKTMKNRSVFIEFFPHMVFPAIRLSSVFYSNY